MHTRLTFGILAVVMLAPLSALAQEAGASGNSRIRVTAPAVADHRLVAQLLSQDSSSLTLAIKGKTMTVPLSAVTQLEVSRRRSWRARGALIGGVAGGVAGLVLGQSDSGCNANTNFGAALGIDGGPGNGCFNNLDLTIPGAIVLGGLGALAGALVAPGEKWGPVTDHHVRLTVTPAFVNRMLSGLEVAMGDSLAMRGIERIADLHGILQRLVERQWPFQRRALDRTPSPGSAPCRCHRHG